MTTNYKPSIVRLYSTLFYFSGSDARFNRVINFLQISKDKVVIVDRHNSCLRMLDRLTGQTSPFVGKCGGEHNYYISYYVFHNKFVCNRTVLIELSNRIEKSDSMILLHFISTGLNLR